MTDYIACGRVVPERIAAIVQGISEACVEAGCALLGGETAEHPGLLGPDEYDVAGAATGVVERDKLLGARTGSGPGTRSWPWPPRDCTRTGTPWSATCCWTGPGGPWTPRSRSSGARWARSCSSPPGSTPVRAWLSSTPSTCTPSRTSPVAGWPAIWPGCCPIRSRWLIDRSSWRPGPVFELVQRVGDVSTDDLEATLNMGVGHGRGAGPRSRRRSRAPARSARHPELGLRRGARCARSDGPAGSGCPGNTLRASSPLDLQPCRHWVAFLPRHHSNPAAAEPPAATSARGSTRYGARPCKGKADQGCPRTEVPLGGHRFHVSGTRTPRRRERSRDSLGLRRSGASPTARVIPGAATSIIFRTFASRVDASSRGLAAIALLYE